MIKLNKQELKQFQKAIEKDYGVKLTGKELYDAAFNLLQFFDALLKLDSKKIKQKSKVRKSS